MTRNTVLIVGLFAVAACESEHEKYVDDMIVELNKQRDAATDSMAGVRRRDSLAQARRQSAALGQLEPPCDGPRPYRNWSNAELSTGMLRAMETDDPRGLDLIAEAGCRAEVANPTPP
jgi:hypothetical protein